MHFLLQWIDVPWVLLGLATARKDQRLWAAGFFAGSMLMMRLLAELMESIGHPNGLLGILQSSVAWRGLIIYSLSYVFYIAMLYFSPRSSRSILMAASLSVFIMTGVIFSLVMVL